MLHVVVFCACSLQHDTTSHSYFGFLHLPTSASLTSTAEEKENPEISKKAYRTLGATAHYRCQWYEPKTTESSAQVSRCEEVLSMFLAEHVGNSYREAAA